MESTWIFLWCTWGCIYCNKEAHLHHHPPSPTNTSTHRHRWKQIHQQFSNSNFSWSQRGFKLGNHQLRVKGCLCKMETKWPSNKMKSTKESLLLWEGIILKGNWGFIIDICYSCRLIRSMNPVWGKFKVKLIRFQSPDWPEACGKSMPQTLCWTQRPIHGQADRPNDHSCITETSGVGGGWLCKGRIDKKLHLYSHWNAITIEYNPQKCLHKHVACCFYVSTRRTNILARKQSICFAHFETGWKRSSFFPLKR